MRPLDRISSIKFKLSVVILAAVGVTVGVHSLGLQAELPLALVGLASGLLALAVIHVLARGMTSPLREMAVAARAMSRGDYSRRVRATSRDEVGELARAFNRMAEDLAETDRIRRDLVANVSHELRTPTSALRAIVENMLDGVESADPASLGLMLDQVDRLGRLVAQLLDLSRLESGTVPFDPREFPLLPLLESAAAESRVQASARDVSVRVLVEPGSLRVRADPDRLRQVAANLLDNAVRHSPAGGTVQLEGVGHDGAVSISVADEGPGIPPEEASRVFERFYRADTARSAGGAGLGLAIVNWIVDLHDGTVRIDENEPTGCRMVVELPLRTP